MQSKQKRILFISPVVPKSDGIGVELRAWTHLEALATVTTDIHLILGMTPAQLNHQVQLDEIRPLCKSVDIIRLQPSNKKETRNFIGLTALTRAMNIYKPSFRSMIFEATELSQRLQSLHFDVVFCFRIRSFEVFESLTKITNFQSKSLFVDFDDIESLSSRRELSFVRKVLGVESTIVACIEVIKTKILESRIQRKVNMISVCSYVDQQRLLSNGCHASVVIIPNSYPRMPALPLRPIGSVAKLLFLGTMSYPPNEDAILFFCEEIFPYIREAYPGDIQLTIVGRRPSERVLAFANDTSILVTGGVDSVEPYYDEADIVVVPIRFGGGTRIKILEALSFGRAVVSTTVGAEGLDLTQGKDIAIADSAKEFALICIELLKNQDKRFSLAHSGRERVAEAYERTKVQHTLIKNIQEL